jgi:hypothetical protein
LAWPWWQVGSERQDRRPEKWPYERVCKSCLIREVRREFLPQVRGPDNGTVAWNTGRIFHVEAISGCDKYRLGFKQYIARFVQAGSEIGRTAVIWMYL